MRERYPNDDNLLEALMGVPGLACRAGYVDEALAAADELQRRALSRYGADNLFTVEATQRRGNLLMLAGRADEAIPLMERAMVGFAKFTGTDSHDVLAAELGLSQAHFIAGHADEAQRLFDRVAGKAQSLHPDDARLAQRLAGYKANTEKMSAGNRPHCGG